jgi:methylphosphotriester-DNA--protein-cysteine methyltransferase
MMPQPNPKMENQPVHHSDISDAELRKQIREKAIRFGGNWKLKIYGLLQCKTGKRMKRENRVFFSSEAEATSHRYRPCGICMRAAYKKWKDGSVYQ